MYFNNSPVIIHTNNINKIQEKYGKNIDTRKLNYDELSDLLSDAERMAISVRKAMNNIEKKDNKIIINNDNEFETINELRIIDEAKNRSLDVSTYDINCEFVEGIFKLHCPLTFKRKTTNDNLIDNYLLSNCIEIAIKKWEKDNSISLKNVIEIPFVCVVERVSNKFNINKICDNDNLENSRIINTITQALSLTDNAKNMDLYLKFTENKDENKEGMNIYLLDKNKFYMATNLL